MTLRSRGVFYPRFALLPAPLLPKRARKGRVPAGTRDPWAKMHTGCHEAAGSTRPSRAMVWTACTSSARWARRLLPSSPSDCRGDIESPVESMRHPQGLTPDT